jgi:purine-nucleoside phosphorylase
LQRSTGGPLDVAVVLGSGLSDAIERRAGLESIPYERLAGSPHAVLDGHPGRALVGVSSGCRVALFAGRVHLYQGFSPNDVSYFVRLAAAAGARTLIVTNAAGGLDPTFGPGDVMVIADQINLTGASPFIERHDGPFVDMSVAYAPRLRALAQDLDPSVREGIYAGVRGPCFETPAEAAALRTLGAHAVGMSTVLETIAARALGLDVLGISLITNALGSGTSVSHVGVVAAAARGGERVAELVLRVLTAMTPQDRLPASSTATTR